MKLSFEEQEKIIEDAADVLKMDIHISHMRHKADLSTMAEKLMGQRTHQQGQPYKQAYLWCDTVDVCFFFSGNFNATACATFTALWLVGSKDLKGGNAAHALQKIEDMLDLMQKKANNIMLGKVVAGGAENVTRP